MEMAALERYRFMKRISIFGVQPGARAGAVGFLQVGGRILANGQRRGQAPAGACVDGLATALEAGLERTLDALA